MNDIIEKEILKMVEDNINTLEETYEYVQSSLNVWYKLEFYKPHLEEFIKIIVDKKTYLKIIVKWRSVPSIYLCKEGFWSRKEFAVSDVMTKSTLLKIRKILSNQKNKMEQQLYDRLEKQKNERNKVLEKEVIEVIKS